MLLRLIVLTSFLLLSFVANASDSLTAMNNELFVPLMEDCKDGKCPIPPKTVCFNLYCSYEKKHNESGFSKCRSAARFNKLVGIDGREILDHSAMEHPTEFEVECDHDLLFNGSGKRFTDDLGTRLQSDGGPYPATLLPKGALREGHRYILSSLEFNNQILHGYCYIYSGAP